MNDTRASAAKYYDVNPDRPADVDFYRARIPSPDAEVLELGCGTGRVLIPLTGFCRYIHGIDASAAMLDICREKLRKGGVPAQQAPIQAGDIADFDLGRQFNLVIAPFRVLQNLETDTQVDGLFSSVGAHLAPGGTCILNVFNPNRSREAMKREWCDLNETQEWEVTVDGRRMTCHDRRPRLEPERVILYVELIYRTYEANALVEETILPIRDALLLPR